jgi:hypothetical protein
VNVNKSAISKRPVAQTGPKITDFLPIDGCRAAPSHTGPQAAAPRQRDQELLRNGIKISYSSPLKVPQGFKYPPITNRNSRRQYTHFHMQTASSQAASVLKILFFSSQIKYYPLL